MYSDMFVILLILNCYLICLMISNIRIALLFKYPFKWIFAIDVNAQCTIFLIGFFLMDLIWFLIFLNFLFPQFLFGKQEAYSADNFHRTMNCVGKIYSMCTHKFRLSGDGSFIHRLTHKRKPIPLKGSKWHGLFVFFIITYYIVYVCIGFGGGFRCFCFIQINMATAQWKW